MNLKKFWWACLVFLGVGCAGTSRSCSSCNAESFGANWIVVQYDSFGQPLNCWQLKNVSISNEPHSDGIYWENSDGHLIHISGFYNRVQVEHNQWESAANLIGVDLKSCTGGKYKVTKVDRAVERVETVPSATTEPVNPLRGKLD